MELWQQTGVHLKMNTALRFILKNVYVIISRSFSRSTKHS